MIDTEQSAAGVDAPANPTRWGPGGPVRRYAPIAALVVLLVIVGIIASRSASSGLPFDPASTDASGTKALAIILERAGGDVSVLADTDDLDVDTLLVLVDNLGHDAVADIESFVAKGGTAVVADPGGHLGRDLRPAGAASMGLFEPAVRRNCAVPALEDVDRVRTGSSPLFVVPDGATGCFGEGDAAWLIIDERGTGTLVMTGGQTFLLNSFIGDVDNAPLAVALLAPRPGTRVGILRPNFAAESSDGPSSLLDLIPPRVTAVALQLTIAFGVIVLWRMRRLGKPVSEPQAVQLAGSELVIAVGNLLQRTGARDRAAQLLRDDFRRSISHRLGLPYDLPAEDMAAVAAERTGADAEQILAALTGPVPATDADLVALAQRLEAVGDAAGISPSVPAGAPRVPTA